MNRRNAGLWVVLTLCGLVFLGLAIQVTGALLSPHLRALISPAPLALKVVGNLGLVISSLSPVLSFIALRAVRPSVRHLDNPVAREVVWLIVLFAVVLSIPEWFWSCNGHPTWFQGYVG